MLTEWTKGVVTHVIDETPTTKRFFFVLPEVERFDFEPGQFVTLDLPIHEKKNKRWRSYSIASAPDGTNTFELVIVKLEGGAGTSWLWQNGHVGSEMLLRGPLGKFVLPETIDTDFYFICTGTGIAPFRSMLHNIKNRHLPHKNLYLIFGTRYFTDTLYGPEFEQLEKELEGFKYLPTYSREPANNHQGKLTGYVHDVYTQLVESKPAQILEDGTKLPASAKFMLCGWKSMIDDARHNLLALGYHKHDIHYELYG
jgi:ferredoxin-NADP reductase